MALSFWERLTEAVSSHLKLIPQWRKQEDYEGVIKQVVDEEFKRITGDQIRSRQAYNKIRKRRILNKMAKKSRKINYGILNNRSKRWGKK